MKRKITFTFMLMFSFTAILQAQETSQPSDTIYPLVEKLQSDFGILNKLKITGYIQAQWQKSDTTGSPGAFSGGDFKGLDNRFNVRRGRIKFSYSNQLSNYVLQFDVTEKGLGIKDAYINFTEPILKTATITAGAFDRPFGYEISFSSSSRETPERSRIFQSLFNQERDLGAKLTLQAPKTSPWNFIRLDAGLFTGNGLNVETDKYKDFIGHIGANKTFMNENFMVGIGASYYHGGWSNQSKYSYKMSGSSFAKDSSYKIGDQVKRQYTGFDAQVSFNTALGITTFRGEYIFGTQPGTSKTNVSPTGIWNNSQTYSTSFDSVKGYTTKANDVVPMEAYLREFNGGYVNLVQSILQTKHEIVFKYDWYDPNTKVSGNQIGAGSTYDARLKKLTNPSGTNASDIKFSTIGIGWIYRWNTNVKITAYYEIVENETTTAEGLNASLGTTGVTSLKKDLKDNIFTLRVQYKF